MNIAIITGPRTAGTYFIKEYLPTQLIGEIADVAHYGTVSRMRSADGKIYFDHSEMFDHRTQEKQSLGDTQQLEAMLNAKHFSHKTGEPIIKKLPPRTNNMHDYVEQCHQYWEKVYHGSTDVHAVKLFRNHLRGLPPLAQTNSINRLVNNSHKVYVLYRKDLSAVLYSHYYAYLTKNYAHRNPSNNEKIVIDPDLWKRLEQSVLLNYEFMLNFAKKHNAEVICTELDLPHKPYDTYHQFSDTQLVCEMAEYYHEEFQRCK